MSLRVEGTLCTSQIYPWVLKPQLALAWMDWGLEHPSSAKGHFQWILQGRTSNFLGKAQVWKQTEEGKEVPLCPSLIQCLCLTPSSLLPQFMLYSPTLKVFVDVIWVCISTLLIRFVQKTAGVQLKRDEAETVLQLLSLQNEKNPNHCLGVYSYDHQSKYLLKREQDVSLLERLLANFWSNSSFLQVEM